MSFQCLTKFGFGSMRFFSRLQRRRGPSRDSYDYTRLLQSCRDAKSLKKIHAQVITSGYQQNAFVAAKLISQYVAAKLISQYAEFGWSMEDGRCVFECVDERDVLLCNVMIRGYANLGPFEEAVNVYDQMESWGVRPNQYTFPFVLKACGTMGDGEKGRKIHDDILRAGLGSDLFVANGLVAVYAKCAEIGLARQVFDEMPVKDLISWNSMIAGYSQNDCSDEALMLFKKMLCDSVEMPDRVTLVALLPACGQSAALQRGMWIHSYSMKMGIVIDVVLGSALVEMYAKCGCLEFARHVFDRMPERNVVAWNAMIGGYGMHGYAEDALEMFSRMVGSCIRPEGISFVYVLSACSHAGLVDKGWQYFRAMDEYHIERTEEHYACMVDLLGRAGCLDEAARFIKRMPLKPGPDVWGALLGACRIHGNLDLAEEAAEHLFVLDPNNAGRYVLLANMYADAGRWGDVARVRKMMRVRRVRKPLGCSVIEVDHVTHIFGIGDESHILTDRIYEMLKLLEMMMEEEGYYPKGSMVYTPIQKLTPGMA